jgi:predicted dehydrogenase
MRKIASAAAELAVIILLAAACSGPSGRPAQGAKGAKPVAPAGLSGEIRLITLDPGHFHASLVQKTMVPGISPVVHVYAPEGPELRDHLHRIDLFNRRAADPTRWDERVYAGPDFLERLARERRGNVVVLAGNNARKMSYIEAAIGAGLNVLADKPMAVTPGDYDRLRAAFAEARKRGVLLYDIMTERSEITTILQRELIAVPGVIGTIVQGTTDEPAVVKASVHHYYKVVSGSPLVRPAWFFDTAQQGEGIVDVTTHLVDLVQWGCFPGEAIDGPRDVVLTGARRWTTPVTRDQFRKSTGLADFPEFLLNSVKDGVLEVSSNGEIDYTLRGIHVRVSVAWAFEPPGGGGDTHFSVIRGTRSSVVIRQDKDRNFIPELYVEPAGGVGISELGTELKRAWPFLIRKYPGLTLAEEKDRWHVIIPPAYRIGHEAHFAQVTERFLQYLREGKLPDWEEPGMLAKYYVTTQALKGVRS